LCRDTLADEPGFSKWRGLAVVLTNRAGASLRKSALLEGRQPIELTPTRLLRLIKDLPHDWKEQRRFLGFPA
jgi:hypothetical protein